MGLTTDERVQALMDFRFTERQARFLELVLRHAGVCVPRQYASFAGIPHGGARCNEFFAKLVRRGYAMSGTCVHNRARVYHVHSKRLYYAIGEPNSRYRRAMPPRLAIERLMWLDAVLASPNLSWLTTDGEKSAFFESLMTTSGDDTSIGRQPVATSDRLPDLGNLGPVGVASSGRIVFLYLATVPWTDEFRRFLQRYAALFGIAPAWTLRVAFPRPIDQQYDVYQRVIRDELETPLQPATIRELKEHFERRRAAPNRRTDAFTEVRVRAADAFERPRFLMLYRRWLKHGEAVLETLSSTVTAEALATGAGSSECIVLPHAYRHLAPLVDRADWRGKKVEKRLRRVNTGVTEPPHVLNRGSQPVPEEPEPSISERHARDWYRLVEWNNQQKALGVRP